jgi:hypothetical protein
MLNYNANIFSLSLSLSLFFRFYCLWSIIIFVVPNVCTKARFCSYAPYACFVYSFLFYLRLLNNHNAYKREITVYDNYTVECTYEMYFFLLIKRFFTALSSILPQKKHLISLYFTLQILIFTVGSQQWNSRSLFHDFTYRTTVKPWNSEIVKFRGISWLINYFIKFLLLMHVCVRHSIHSNACNNTPPPHAWSTFSFECKTFLTQC